jgi:hypothetical protein
MSTTSKHLPLQRNEQSSGPRVLRGGRSAQRSRLQPRRPTLVALGIQAPSSAISVMGPPNRAPGVGIMGGVDRGPRLDLMGGADRGPRLDVMGGPDRVARVDVMGESDPGFVDSLFTGQTDSVGAR